MHSALANVHHLLAHAQVSLLCYKGWDGGAAAGRSYRAACHRQAVRPAGRQAVGRACNAVGHE
eukprot:1159814-Pelagomonas_calceolata.AAC.3